MSEADLARSLFSSSDPQEGGKTRRKRKTPTAQPAAEAAPTPTDPASMATPEAASSHFLNPLDPCDSPDPSAQGITALQQALEQAQAQSQAYEHQVASLEETLQSHQHQAEAERQQLQQQRDQAQEQLTQHQEQIQYLRTALHRLQGEKDALEAKLQQAQQDLQQAQQDLQQAQHHQTRPGQQQQRSLSQPRSQSFPNIVIQRPIAPNTSPTDLDVPPYLLD